MSRPSFNASSSSNHQSGEKVPPNWLGCPSMGEIVGGIFLPFKTPAEDSDSHPNLKFDTQDFLDEIKRKQIKVGLIINLCYTEKYYNNSDFQDHPDLEYSHIPCRGHNEAPQAKEQASFVKRCNAFLSKNPDKIIAVHCTHGYNRTGFMICAYLSSERDWSIDAAVSLFATKRKPGIYKQDYLDRLFEMFAESDEEVMKAPPKPDWDSDYSRGDISESNSINKAEFFEGITDVSLVRDEALKHRIYGHCCELCNYNANGGGIAFPGAHPVSMDPTNIQLLKTRRYRVSWKADGTRYMMYIEDEDNIFFLTRSHHLWRVTGLKFPKLEDMNSHLSQTLLDGEMVTDIIDGKKIPKYLIYDVISLNGNIVAGQNFDKRCGLIKCVIIAARRKAKQMNMIPPDGEPFKVAEKGFFYLKDARKTLELKVTHEKDGLIFQPVDAPYTGGTCHEILKWKPPHLNSVDFRLVIREERQPACLPENYAYLHVSNRPVAITKFKLTRDLASYHKYNNKIVEMTWDIESRKWTVIRERTDKVAANSFETAKSTIHSIQNPVTEKFLFEFIASIPPEKIMKTS